MTPTRDLAISPGSIVVGIDGSVPSTHALLWAAEQASLEGRALTLVHGLGLGGAPWLDSYGIDHVQVVDAMRGEGDAALEAARVQVEQGFPGVEVQLLMQLVDPRVALLELAPLAAMLVVGSRGRGPVAGLVLGSVSAAVSRHAPCPVVVLRPHDPGDVRRGILLGVDGSGGSASAVDFAYRLASARCLPLTVLHCFFDTTSTTRGPREVPYDTPGLEDERLVLDESINGMGEKFPDVVVTLLLGRGLPDDLLAHAAASQDVVVVGAHGSRRLLDSVLEPRVDRAMVHHAPSIVAVVPEDEPDETAGR